jgi:hypothetical protein
MSKREYLKRKNQIMVVPFMFVCVATYATFLSGADFSWHELEMRFAELSKRNGVLAAFMPALVLILGGVLSASMKARLIFWRWRYALPGHRVFTKLAPKDCRVNMKAVEAKMITLPTEPKEQNAAWYKLYEKYEDNLIVKASHKQFLVARDMSIISLVFSLGGTIGLAFARLPAGYVLSYCLIMFLLYILLAITAQNHGKRFVCNVLVEYLKNQ